MIKTRHEIRTRICREYGTNSEHVALYKPNPAALDYRQKDARENTIDRLERKELTTSNLQIDTVLSRGNASQKSYAAKRGAITLPTSI